MPLKEVLAVLGVAALAGHAQAAGGTAPAGPTVDMSALRYYAVHHETARVAAEIHRLRSLYPDWQPPADPAAIEIPDASDIQALWTLFGADKLAELHAEIARRQTADPNFSVPADLAAKLALKEARLALITASDKNDFAMVVTIVGKTPQLADPADLDVAWRVVEAYGRTGAGDKALELDRAILANSQDSAVRLATARKAVEVLPPAELDALLSSGKIGPDGRSEFESASLDLARQRLARIVSGASADTLAPADLTRLETSARTPTGASDAALLGWWHYARKEWGPANDAFRLALAALPSIDKASAADAKIAQGAALTLKELGRLRDAETLSYQWRNNDPELALLYLDLVEPDLTRPQPVAIEPERLQRFSDAVLAQQSGDGAQALGWYAYNIRQFAAARAWFEKAMAWQPRESTALGMTLSLQQLGDKSALVAFLAQNKPTFPSLSAVERSQPQAGSRSGTSGRKPGGMSQAAAMAAAYNRKDYARCLEVAAGHEAIGRLDGAASLQKGWCLTALNRPAEAAIAFASARGSGADRGDAAYGQALAELSSGHSEAAVAAASAVPLSAQRRNEIGIAALAQRAVSAFNSGRYEEAVRLLDRRRAYAPESRDLMMLRGWSFYHTGRVDEARAIFAVLDQQLSTRESQTGLAAVSPRSRN
jgi:tetratricopeptide (TPR) repeat protein